MKKVNVWEVEVWYPEEEEWKEYQYYSFSKDSSVILSYLKEDEGELDDYSIQWDDEWSMEEFHKMVGEESSHSLICDFND
jgi:hypothetical protein